MDARTPPSRYHPSCTINIRLPAASVGTTSSSYGPMKEPTPDASPVGSLLSPSPMDEMTHHSFVGLLERHFKPQLIDTARRSHRAGDKGPAMRPTDKTDITPYTNHIYARRRSKLLRTGSGLVPGGPDDPPDMDVDNMDHDDDDNGYLNNEYTNHSPIDVDAALAAAFPNSEPREGGVAHFYFGENSADDAPIDSGVAAMRAKPRRSSTNLGISWWHLYMQSHARHRTAARMREHADSGYHGTVVLEAVVSSAPASPVAGRAGQVETPRPAGQSDLASHGHDECESDSEELDKMDLSLPEDTLWLTAASKDTPSPAIGPAQFGSDFFMPLVPPDPYIVALHKPYQSRPISPAGSLAASARVRGFVSHQTSLRPLNPPGFVSMATMEPSPWPTAAAAAVSATIPAQTDVSGLPAEVGFTNQGSRVVLNVPPLLGKTLKFRRCLSPKQTKLDPNHKFGKKQELHDKARDPTGRSGLWNGYCVRSNSGMTDGAQGSSYSPRMIATPMRQPSSNPDLSPGHLLDPATLHEAISSYAPAAATLTLTSAGLAPSLFQARLGSAPGVLTGPKRWSTEPAAEPVGAGEGNARIVHGAEGRRRRPKLSVQLDEKIASEFNNRFVTQVYNYLSLGYPVTARDYDAELCKITGVGMADLRTEDERVMAQGQFIARTRARAYPVSLASGSDDDGAGGSDGSADDDDDLPDDAYGPRWRALKAYIIRWARQHPDLDSPDPLAWGVLERRGSWAV